MKPTNKYFITTGLSFFSILLFSFTLLKYNPEYVTFTTSNFNGYEFKTIKLERRDNRVKARYFAAKDKDGKTVPNRYKNWASGRNIISVCSGTYMNNCAPDALPVSLTIDQGNIINNTLATMDGLVIVYASGEIVVGNSKTNEIKLGEKNYNLSNSLEKAAFLKWCETNKATVFQTHLLIYNNKLTIFDNSSPTMRERRFLAGCTDEEGNNYEFIIHMPKEISLMDGAKHTQKFLIENEEMKKISYLINLDTGCQDYFQTYNSNGQERTDFKGRSTIEQSINLICFYFE